MNVLLAITNIVVSASNFFRVSAMWVPSILETKWTLGPTLKGFKASVTMRGPRSEPPMPILTTSVILLPLNPKKNF